MSILISILILVVVVAIAIWIINLIPFPAGTEIIKFVLIAIVAILALIRIFGYLG